MEVMVDSYPKAVDISIEIENLIHEIPRDEREIQRFLRRAQSNMNNVLLELEAVARYTDTGS